MRITQLSLNGIGAWPNLQIDNLRGDLNVFFAPPQAGKSTIAQLVSHLLYGKESSSWRAQFGCVTAPVEGSVTVHAPQGEFVMRRHYDSSAVQNNSHARLTIAAAGGQATDSQTAQSLLAGLSSQQANQLFSVDFAEPPQVENLLRSEIAKQFASQSYSSSSLGPEQHRSCCNGPTELTWSNQVDRRRVEELVRQRDAIAEQLQEQVGRRRQESGVLEQEIADLEINLKSKHERMNHLQTNLRGIELELGELETRLRYYSTKAKSHRPGSPLGNELEQQLSELDEEISRCRNTLEELRSRKKVVRTELAKVRPDGTADKVTCLADGRATLRMLEQLIQDLDAEVSLLARAAEPGRCVGHESHARLQPVANMLRQQVYTLCGQWTEQEQHVNRQNLKSELRQLERVLTDLSERLEQLLSRRESLVLSAQLAGQPVQFLPQAPVENHCCCKEHYDFVHKTDTANLGRLDRETENRSQSQLSRLQQDRLRIVDELTALQLDVSRLEANWKELQNERAHLLGGAILENKQAELERLERMIEDSLHTDPSQTAKLYSGNWRASDVLAQLTNGRFVQIRIEQNYRNPLVVDRHGRTQYLDRLSGAERDQVYLSLTLALVNGHATHGIHLPLVLDEPFLRQDSASVATMTGVLEEFARAGHQVLVFTEQLEAKQRFVALGSNIFELEKLRQSNPVAGKQTTFAAALGKKTTFESETTTSTRLVRESFDGQSTPILKLATVASDGNDDLFYLKESSTWKVFPVMGSETAALFALIDIRSIGDLLAADAAEVAGQLNQPDIDTQTVQLWQSHMCLMCYVPELNLNDAQLLTHVGVYSPEDLFEVNLVVLSNQIEEFLSTARGRRFTSSRNRYSRNQLESWQRGALRMRDRWQQSTPSGIASGVPTAANKTARRRRSNHRDHTERKNKLNGNSSKREWRFSLSRKNEVEEAPSIGPKTADRLAKVGIRSVADLLNANPESAAEELDVNHIKAKTIAAWQHQARLVCQIPGLPGYGAQLLVASGFTEPEQIAGTSVDEMVGKILAFCQTKEGQRIMRSADAPQREKIAEWIDGANHHRPLEAA